MNIQIFGARKSFDTKKAERWFKERRIKYQYIDLDSKGLSPGEYRSIRAAVGYDALVDRDSFSRLRDSASTAQFSARTISPLLHTWSSGKTSPVKGSVPSAKMVSSSFARCTSMVFHLFIILLDGSPTRLL